MSPARSLLLAAALSIPAHAPCQDMVAVDWDGSLYTLDSLTGAATWLGVGAFGQNCLARDSNGVLWSNGRGSGNDHYLTRIDPVQRTATLLFQTGDMRALAAAPGGGLYGVTWENGINRLYWIDSATGAHNLIGATGTGVIQGMTMHNGLLVAWDLNRGLGQLSVTTGAYTDIGTGTGGNLQWLAVRSDGQLVGGGLGLFTIDATTGVHTLYATAPYLRGAETAQFAAPFGTGCAGGTGIVELSVTGSLRPGSLLSSTSIGHTHGSAMFGGFGMIALGTSRTNSQGVPLPRSLDPLFGTVGCTQWTSIDAFAIAGTLSTTSFVMLQRVIPLPPTLTDYTFHLQHFGFDQVPGGLSASNGVTVHVTN